MLLLLTQMVFIGKIHEFLQLCWIIMFGTEPISTLKMLNCRKHSFLKLPQFSQGNNVLDAPSSNTDGILCRDIRVSSTTLNMLIWNKMSLSRPWKLWFALSIPFKNWLSSHRECMCSMLQLLTYVAFIGERHVFFHLGWIGLFGTTESIHLENIQCKKYSFQN
jgi:hypothetical protein